MGDEIVISSQQDALRPIRQFVGLIGGAVAGYENATYGMDSGVYNIPGGYQVIGGQRVAVEGTPYGLPIRPTAAGGLYISPTVVLIGVGIAFAMLWKK